MNQLSACEETQQCNYLHAINPTTGEKSTDRATGEVQRPCMAFCCCYVLPSMAGLLLYLRDAVLASKITSPQASKLFKDPHNTSTYFELHDRSSVSIFSINISCAVFDSLCDIQSMGSSVETVVAGKATGTAAILAIGTANPSGVMYQKDFPDYYFNISNSNHMVALKEKFRRICDKTMIEKRHRFLNDETIRENPNIVTYLGSSVNIRQEMCDVEIPLLGSEAARKALGDWGRPVYDITHLIVCNSGAASMPGADYDIVRLLGLPNTTRRFMLYQTGCFGGGTVLRLAKDLAENNPGARVLAICCEITSIGFRGPCETNIENLVSQALFGDGAGAVIVGADAHAGVERPIFEIASAYQRILPGSDGGIVGKLREAGLMVTLQPQVPIHISANVENIVREALKPLGVKDDLEQLFWVVHPGGAAILDKMEEKLGLKGANKFWASREVLRQFGNMSSPSVIFAMEVMKKRSEEQGMITAGEGLEWGVLLGFGPGITVETVVLHCPMA